MTTTLNPFEELLVGLVDAQVDFITVGGLACAFSGYVRATEDVDILIKRTPENIRRLIKFLSSYGHGFGSELTEQDFADEEGAIRVNEFFSIDIFVVMAGKHYEELEKFKELYPLANHEIPYLNAEGLVTLKRQSLRDKDKMDVIQLEMLKK
jgi:hypothetical protein